jgi:hypothetical protein
VRRAGDRVRRWDRLGEPGLGRFGASARSARRFEAFWGLRRAGRD